MIRTCTGSGRGRDYPARARDKLEHNDGRSVDAKRILSLLTLGAEAGAAITLQASGEDEDAALHGLEKLVVSNFGE